MPHGRGMLETPRLKIPANCLEQRIVISTCASNSNAKDAEKVATQCQPFNDSASLGGEVCRAAADH